MKTGTKSVLFGAHCFLIHPIFVGIAWTRLYGPSFDPRVWMAWCLHDLGYIGKVSLDDAEGEKHVELGANIMHRLFDGWYELEGGYWGPILIRDTKWRDLCLYHSRFYAKKDNKPISKLCIADKFAIAITPWWLYLPMVKLTGEWREYTEAARTGKYATMNQDDTFGLRSWYLSVQDYLKRWVAAAIQNGGKDTWT